MTHHHPNGYLGSLATALFTSYAIQKKPVKQWGSGLMDIFPKALEHVKERGIAVDENVKAWDEFIEKWKTYIKFRGIETDTSQPIFPDSYDMNMSEDFYKSISTTNRPGSTAFEATLIANDVFLAFDGSWEDLCVRSICHGGLSNVICTITACWYGAMYGYDGVSKCNYATVELMFQIETFGLLLYQQSDHSFRCKVEQPPTALSVENTGDIGIESTGDVTDTYERAEENLNSLIDQKVAEIRKDVTTNEVVNIGKAIYSHLRNFLDKFGDKHPEYKVSELLKVGSFHEGTKICFADEFDFIAVLTEFSKPGVFTIESSRDEGADLDLNFGSTSEKGDVSHAFKLMTSFSSGLYNVKLTDRIPTKGISLFRHINEVDWMALPTVNNVELLVRFCEARSPNMIWEFLYKDRRISVDLTIAVRYSNVDEFYNPESAPIPEIGRAVIERGSLLLVACMGGFRKTITETEIEYVRTRLSENHRTLYMYLKHLNYKYGEHIFLQRIGCNPFSFYMLKTICIYHDQNCKDETAGHESCLQDVVQIMDTSISSGYLREAEIFEETVIGYLPSIFNKSKNLYKELHKPVDGLSELRKIMIRDIRQLYLSGRKWSNLSHLLRETNAVIAASREEAVRKDWSNPHNLIWLKEK